jgi:hypothetical protein
VDSAGLIAGDSIGLMAGDSAAAGLMAGDSAGLIAGDSAALMVASGEAVGLSAAGVTFSVFCSQAASKAALARMQMYFFIGLESSIDTTVKSSLTARQLFSRQKGGVTLSSGGRLARRDERA